VAVQFDGSASNDPNGKPVTLAWDFGDPASGAANTSTAVRPTHTYMKAGNYTVTLTVTDAAGLKTTSTTTAAIANIVPSISAISGARLMLGEGFTATGSFADADPDSWTATVDYGDGTGTQPLALNGKSFSLSHLYTAAGSHTIRVTVRDDDGGADAATVEIIVWTPQQGIQATLIDAIEAGSIPEANATSLVAPLRAAQASLENGNANAANGQLQAFINHVAALVRGDKISVGTGAELTAKARRVMSSINR
jgi:PKD repeat protein